MITADEQMRVKEFYFGAATGEPPRRKDIDDIAVLRELLGVPPPEQYPWPMQAARRFLAAPRPALSV